MFLSRPRILFWVMCVSLAADSGWFASNAALNAQEEQSGRYVLPENGSAVIFVYDLQNGFNPPRQNKTPMLLIRANGKIEMPSLYGEGRNVRGNLSDTELQSFLKLVIEDNKFGEYDSNRVQGRIEEIRERRQVPQIADLPDTIIELEIPGHSQRVRQPAVGMLSEFSEVTAFQQLLAIRKAVNLLMSETRVGGKQGIMDLLTRMNTKLKEAYPEVAPLQLSDFSGSYLRQDGAISATISRPGRGANGKPNGTYVNGTAVIARGSDEPEITLRVKLK